MNKKKQTKEAMDQLFNGLTAQSSSPDEYTQRDSENRVESSIQKKYKEENERVCTIMEYDDIYKLRFIASKENLSIRDVFGAAAKMLIKKYESTNGPIPVKKKKQKKGDISKLFDI